jgi:hypothetical protein
VLHVVGQVVGDDNDRRLWEVETNDPEALSSFIVGQVPPGFREVTPFDKSSVNDNEVAIQVYDDSGRPPEYRTLKTNALRPDSVLDRRGRYLLPSEFEALNTCNS